MVWRWSVIVAAVIVACSSGIAAPAPCTGEENAPSRAEQAEAARQWAAQIRQWRAKVRFDQAEEGPDSAEAKAGIRAIAAPEAAPALEGALKREKNHNQRFLYYEALANIATADSLEILVRASVEETDGMRQPVARLIRKVPNVQDAIPHYVRYLRSVQYANHAAEALSESEITSQRQPGQQPDRELVYALIKALVGSQRGEAIVWDSAYQERVTRLGPGRGFGISRSGRFGPRRVYFATPAPNEKVLSTLREYTGQNYGYQQESWRTWYSANYGPYEPGLRRTSRPEQEGK